MHPLIRHYNENLSYEDSLICDELAAIIDGHLDDSISKIWHAHPVWFIDDNPIVGYSKQKKGIRLMFWSGADFMEDVRVVKGKKFKDASIFYNNLLEIDKDCLKYWLGKSREIQWDYKNIVKSKGRLERI
jgi:hypothetical protein